MLKSSQYFACAIVAMAISGHCQSLAS